jgi:transcriptional regulator with XRE-family HTH domain
MLRFMPLTDRDGRTARQCVSRMLSRGVRDGEMASALGLSISTYSRRKDRPDFPTYHELRRLAENLHVDETLLLIDFGYVDVSTLNERLQRRYRIYRTAVDVLKALRGQGDSATVEDAIIDSALREPHDAIRESGQSEA